MRVENGIGVLIKGIPEHSLLVFCQVKIRTEVASLKTRKCLSPE